MQTEVKPDTNLRDFSDVVTTSLLTLYCRALESQSRDAIIVDPIALEMMEKFNDQLKDAKDRLTRKMVSGRVDKRLLVHIALRSNYYDDTIREFLQRHPDGVIVNIGCGMDPRFPRIDNGRVILYDLDLPEVINAKKKFIETTERYHMLATSVLEHGWMDAVLQHGQRPTLFAAEGVFMYLDPAKVKKMILTLQQRFPGSEMVFEVVNKRWVGGFMKKMTSFKMQKQLGLGKGAEFLFGISPKDELESWHSGIQFLEDWSYFDTNHPKLGWMGIFRHSKLFRGTQYTVRYQLNKT